MMRYLRFCAFALLGSIGMMTAALALEAIVIVPKDENIISKGGYFGAYHVSGMLSGSPTMRQRLVVSRPNNGIVEVHRRVDNGKAGSGIIYRLNFLDVDPDYTVITGKVRSADASKPVDSVNVFISVTDTKTGDEYQSLL